MPLPTLSRSWSFSTNNAWVSNGSQLSAYQNLWFLIKSTLKNLGGWTVMASSNATVADTFDNWTSTASLNWSTTSRSWIILQHPANASQLLIDLNHIGTSSASLLFSKQGWNVGGALSTSAIPALTTSGDSHTLISSTAAWGGSDKGFAHHYMYSNDNYCHRHFVYVEDRCVLGLFLETPENYVPGWTATGLPSYAMIFNAAAVSNAITTSAHTSAKVLTRIGTSTNISAYLSGETAFINGVYPSVIPYEITNRSIYNNSYAITEPGIVSVTAPYRGKMGKPIDLWFGMPSFLGATTYPDDNTRQFVSHGALVTPWNGGPMRTR